MPGLDVAHHRAGIAADLVVGLVRIMRSRRAGAERRPHAVRRRRHPRNRTPVACRIALRMAGAVGTSAGSPMPLAPKGPRGSASSIRMRIDRRHVADGGDEIVVQISVRPGMNSSISARPRPCATPPWIWPSTWVGLMARPTSCAATMRRTLHACRARYRPRLGAMCAEAVEWRRARPGRSSSSGVVGGSKVSSPSARRRLR